MHNENTIYETIRNIFVFVRQKCFYLSKVEELHHFCHCFYADIYKISERINRTGTTL